MTIEEKPEVRKTGGVYYTPRYIVKYIVAQTVGKLLGEISGGAELPLRPNSTVAAPGGAAKNGPRGNAALSSKDSEKRTLALRFLDPACGSGSFLIRVFEAVCEYWEKHLTDDLRRTFDPKGSPRKRVCAGGEPASIPAFTWFRRDQPAN